ncbi:hypothetical protein K3495_g8445 [Podosphaera aphanis]|nr:hypothetical protein K3495_g8445 [Podosphaera aphanis]
MISQSIPVGVYSPELSYIFRSSQVVVDGKVKGGSIELRLRYCLAGPKGTPNALSDRKPRGRPKKEPAITFTKTSTVTSIEDTLKATSMAPSNIITEGPPSGSSIVPAFTIAESSPSADPKTLSLNSPNTSVASAHDIPSAPVI